MHLLRSAAAVLLGAASAAVVLPGRADAQPSPTCTPPQQQSVATVPAAQSGYLDQLQPQRAWALSRGAGVTVALLDTGVGPGLAGTALSGRLADGGTFAGDGAMTGLLDCDGRGSADAGFLAARSAGSELPGIAPAARLLAVRVQAGATTPPAAAAVAAGIDAAVRGHARVIVVASPCADSAALKASVAAAIRAGSVVVASVGDDPTVTTAYPAAYPGVLGVAAAGDGSDRSVHGPFIDLVAPASALAGVGVRGTGYVPGIAGAAPAAAFVGGTVALMRSLAPAVPVATVVARIEYAADHPASALPSPTEGWGTVDPYAATALPPSVTAPPSAARGSTVPAVRLPPKDRPGHRFAGALVGAGLVVAALGCGLAVAGVRRARRRGWRSA